MKLCAATTLAMTTRLPHAQVRPLSHPSEGQMVKLKIDSSYKCWAQVNVGKWLFLIFFINEYILLCMIYKLFDKGRTKSAQCASRITVTTNLWQIFGTCILSLIKFRNSRWVFLLFVLAGEQLLSDDMSLPADRWFPSGFWKAATWSEVSLRLSLWMRSRKCVSAQKTISQTFPVYTFSHFLCVNCSCKSNLTQSWTVHTLLYQLACCVSQPCSGLSFFTATHISSFSSQNWC